MRLPFANPIQTYLKKRKKNVLDWKKRYAELQKKLAESEEDRKVLYNQVQAWKERISTAYGVMESITQGEIQWYDPGTLSQEAERRYRLDAKVVLENRTFQNEVQRLQADWIKYLALESKDFGEVRDMRMQLSGIKLIKERLEDLQKFTS